MLILTPCRKRVQPVLSTWLRSATSTLRTRAAQGVLWSLALGALCPAVAAAQTLTYGPILGRGQTGDQMIVRWGTSATSDATSVVVRKQGDSAWLTVAGAAARDHEVILTGLELGKVYEYEVRSLTGMPQRATFATCPRPGLPMDIAFYGDSRSGPTQHAKVLQQVAAKKPEMIFESGDIVPYGGYSEYLNEFFPKVKDVVSSTPFMAAPGNHDAILGLQNAYALVFPTPRTGAWQPYYSFQCGSAQFISLNSNAVTDAAQITFLKNSLEAARGNTDIKQVLVWFHHSAYSPGQHGDSSTVQASWVPLFNDPRYKVTAVFSGHDHIYARMKDSSDVFYVVSGGAGAPLYSDSKASKATKVTSKSAFNFVALRIAGLTLSGVAYDDSGVELDRFSFTRSEPPVDPPMDVDMAGGPPADMSTTPSPDLAMEMPPPPAGGCAVVAVGQKSPLGVLGMTMVGLVGALALLRRKRQRSSATA